MITTVNTYTPSPNRQTKMVAITFRCQGLTFQAFVDGVVGPDGKTRITASDYAKAMNAVAPERGMTVSVG